MTRPLLVVGWDGADWGVCQPLLDAGLLPHLAALQARGAWGPLCSTVPPVTAAGWTALATGLDPGGTGVLNFRRFDFRRLDGYHPALVDGADTARHCWFHRVPGGVASICLPLTWPTFSLPGGLLVAGFPRPPLPRTPVQPPSWVGRLPAWPQEEAGNRAEDGDQASLDACLRWDRHHTEVALSALAQRQDRMTVVVLSGTDHAGHLFWGDWATARERGAPFDDPLSQVYRHADACLGRLLEGRAGWDVWLVSDHGFGPARSQQIHLARWLAEAGWLRWRGPAPSQGPAVPRRSGGGSPSALRRLRARLPTHLWRPVQRRLPRALLAWLHGRAHGLGQIDAAGTRAVFTELYPGHDAVWLNLQGRQPTGVVPAHERGAQVERLAQDLAGLVLPDGARPTVRRREQCFQGPHLPEMPDLVVSWPPPWRSGRGLGPGPRTTPLSADLLAQEPGTHQQDGIVVAAGPGIRPGSIDGARLIDLAPTLVRQLGWTPPDEFPGVVLEQALRPDRLPRAAGPLPSGPALTARSASPDPAVRRRLEALGYL